MGQSVGDATACRTEFRNISAVIEVRWDRGCCGSCARKEAHAEWTGFSSETSVNQVSIAVVGLL
jgi:hypothetical protein